jgi:hypothetical protein
MKSTPSLRLAFILSASTLVVIGSVAAQTAAPAVTPPTSAAPTPAAAGGAAPVFSEDFESGKIDPAIWDTRVANQAEVKLQSTVVHGGKFAFQVHYPKGVNGSYGFIVAPHLPDAVRTHLFGRAYVYITAGMPGGHDPLLSAGTAGWPKSNFLEVGASGGKNVMASYQQNSAKDPNGETISKMNPPYPVAKWFCLEWEFNDHPDSINVWIDGQPVGELKNFSFKPRTGGGGAVKGDELVKGFNDFAIGFRYWGSAKNEYDIYYDDIVIDTKRVGPAK